MIGTDYGKISIHELLAVARESEGRDYVKGDAMLCEKRFRKDTAHMAEFMILKDHTGLGKKGEHHRRFLTESEYGALLSFCDSNAIRFQRYASVRGSELFYSSAHPQAAGREQKAPTGKNPPFPQPGLSQAFLSESHENKERT